MNAPLTVALTPDFHSIPSPGAAAAWSAQLELGFERRGGRSVLARRAHCGPLRVQKALYPEGDAVCHAIIVHPPAGIAGGDQLTLRVAVDRGAHALLTTPGAGKWYRSAGASSRMLQEIEVASGAVCEWLPQEGIVFDCALGELATRVDLRGDAVFFGMEMQCFGRTGSGERFEHGEFLVDTRIDRDGRPVWRERGLIEGGGALLDSPVGLGGSPVCGNLLVAAPGLDRGVLDACRAIAPRAGEGAVTLLPDLLVARYLGPSCEAGRAWLARIWGCLRPRLTGHEAVLPRIWNT
jgi:urease accessory protein